MQTGKAWSQWQKEIICAMRMFTFVKELGIGIKSYMELMDEDAKLLQEEYDIKQIFICIMKGIQEARD